MDDTKQQVVDRLKQANNILVTVRNNPSVDLLSACIGLSLVLDKLDKHAAAVFSGEVPSVMEFLKPEETIEQTPNSLRDFIIALDKSKADKLRYKVEDKVVRIFITPYKTSLTKDDLEFSEGDFNIDVVVALGVHEQAELDAAITEHGRILHDATVISINNTPNGNLGSLNWQQISGSSVSEMVTDLALQLGSNVLDEQIATALLTGVVAETARFSNDKTTPQTMRIAGELMAAGANQQLVANELRKNADELPHDPGAPAADVAVDDNGTLQITHPTEPETTEPQDEETSKPDNIAPMSAGQGASTVPDEATEREMLPMPELENVGTETPSAPAGDGLLTGVMNDEEPKEDHGFLVDQPAITGQSEPNSFVPGPEPDAPILTHGQPVLPSSEIEPAAAAPVEHPAITPEASAPAPIMPEPVQNDAAFGPAAAPTAIADPNVGGETSPNQTLESIEESVNSPHLANAATPEPTGNLDEARMQVLEALRQGPQPLDVPPAAFNAHPFGPPLHEDVAPETVTFVPPASSTSIEVDREGNLTPAPVSQPTSDPMAATPGMTLPAPNALDMPLPPVMPGPSPSQPQATDQNGVPPQAPPPLGPPPFTPQSFM